MHTYVEVEWQRDCTSVSVHTDPGDTITRLVNYRFPVRVLVHDGYGGYDENIYENDRDPQCENLYHLGAKWVTDDPQELRKYISYHFDTNNANDKLKNFLKGD